VSVLVGFEQSQEVTAAFIALGYDAMSCDLNYPGEKGLPHYQGNIFDLLCQRWDLIIIHPPCTYTALCGNRWYWNSPLRPEGIDLCVRAWNEARKWSDKVALEQPKTIMQRYIGKRSQAIQPYQFGHGETKETWLWLRGLPLLIPTNEVNGRKHRIHEMPPGPDRQKERSRTYSGIANAMAAQWSVGLTPRAPDSGTHPPAKIMPND
jgi:hypothetical protein